jgi:AcrR family transcriptional regulator
MMAVSARGQDAIGLASRRLLDGTPVRMREVAAELEVSRVTLHRWVGSREELLGEALWALAADNVASAVRATRTRGGRRIADVVGRYVRAVQAAPGIRAFVEREPELAMRLLTTKAAPVQVRSVAVVEGLLREEVEAGEITPPMRLHDLAYVIVRISESFLWADLIAGEVADEAKARQAIVALLR